MVVVVIWGGESEAFDGNEWCLNAGQRAIRWIEVLYENGEVVVIQSVLELVASMLSESVANIPHPLDP